MLKDCTANKSKGSIAQGVSHVGLDAILEGGGGDECDGALAGKQVMVNHATDADHGKAAVLDLLELQVGQVGLAEAEGVEHEITRLPGAALDGLVDSGESANLDETNPEKQLRHGGSLLVACKGYTSG